MHFKTNLSEKTIQVNETKSTLQDAFDGFFIESKQTLENAGFKLTENHEKDGLHIEDFEDNNKNEIRLVNDHFIIYKKDTSKIFNWSCNLTDVVRNIIRQEDNPVSVQYFFNFPVGRFSDKGLIDILRVKNVEPMSVLNNNIQDDDFLYEQFFNTEKNLDSVIQNICEPMNSDFSILDLVDIGYLKSSRENSYFIEDKNHYFQNHNLPNVIYFNEESKPIAKKFEKSEPRGHLIMVNLVEKTIEHSLNKVADQKDYAIFITYKDNQFDLEKDKAILMLKPKQKHIRKMLPLMGYPNVYSFDQKEFEWFIGKDPHEMTDFTSDVKKLLKDKKPESLNDAEKAYFNYHFKIGNDNDMFEDVLDSLGNPDFQALDPDEFMFIEPCLEGEHIYKQAFEKLKASVEEQEAS